MLCALTFESSMASQPIFVFCDSRLPISRTFATGRGATQNARLAPTHQRQRAQAQSAKKRRALRSHNLESLKPAAFVLRNIDIALGIHGGANGIKELAREEKASAAADR